MRIPNARVLRLAGLASAALFLTQGAAHADALSSPSMSGPLAANPNPFSVDLPDWLGSAGGKVYIDGAATGIAFAQSNPGAMGVRDVSSLFDLSNGQVFIQKTDGWLQFYLQVGDYSLPVVGAPYVKSSKTPSASFGYAPEAYVKLVGQGDWSSWSIEAGKLPTLIGDEYTFTFENMNVNRGLLWNTEPAISRGVQVNYAQGPLTVSLSLNDGTYSDKWNVLSGLISYAFNGGADTLAFAASGNLGNPGFSLLNSGSVYDLIYTHTSGPWTISPYMQYNETPSVGFLRSSSVWAGAILASYSFNDNWKLAMRGEYESQTGTKNVFATGDIIGYGPGSGAWSITLTPTYQWKLLYARVDLAAVGVQDGSAGLEFGKVGNSDTQFRSMLEFGLLF